MLSRNIWHNESALCVLHFFFLCCIIILREVSRAPHGGLDMRFSFAEIVRNCFFNFLKTVIL